MFVLDSFPNSEQIMKTTVKVKMTKEQKAAQRKAQRAAIKEMCESLGIHRVRGCVSGRTYYE